VSESIKEICDYYLQHYPVPGDNFSADDVAEDAKTLAKELTRLQAVVERLPKTADGVPVTPGMRVWHCARHRFGPKGGGENYKHEGLDVRMPKPYCLGEHCWYDGCQSDDGGGRHCEWSECYSTREALEAAEAAKGGE
jgi:hypothetical protein